MSKLGMDSDQIRSLATRLDGQAGALESVGRCIDGLVQQMHSTWHGNDAEDFAGWWANQHRPALVRAQQSIAGLAISARNNANEQDRVSGSTGTAPNTHGSTGAGSHPVPTAPIAGPTHSTGPNGTQDYSAQKSIDLARGEIGTSRPTGYDQPGECVKSVQRWVSEAGGHFGGGGVVSGYENSGAVSVSMADVKAGDVLQFTSTMNPDSWGAGPVHTVLIAGVNADGSYDIVQSNSPAGSGLVSEVTHWTPRSATDMQWRGWRFAAKS